MEAKREEPACAETKTNNRTPRRKPKGRFGDKTAGRPHHSQDLVFDRVNDERDSQRGGFRPSTAPPNSNTGKFHRKPRFQTQSDSTESNWRVRDEVARPSSASAGRNFRRGTKEPLNAGRQPRMFDDVPSSTRAAAPTSEHEEEPANESIPVNSVRSNLNVMAAPFVPTSRRVKANQNMTKLGKVKRNRQQGKSKRALDDVRIQPTENTASEVAPASDTVLSSRKYEQPSHQHSAKKDGRNYQQSSRKHQGRQVKSASREPSEAGSDAGCFPPDERRVSEGERELVRTRNRALHSFKEVKPVDAVDIVNLREHMIENLTNGSYECNICYVTIGQDKAIWSCDNCYHLFHFYCLKKWANTLLAQDQDNTNWRCPTCQQVYTSIPNQYRCFCSKVRDPVWNNYDTPHSCGEVCGKKRADNCKHPCNELCHPGPCPPCSAYTSRHCLCGRSCQRVKCSQTAEVRCEQKCDRQLNCLKHTCAALCHSGPCQPCSEMVEQECWCGEEKRTVVCGSDGTEDMKFCCKRLCGKPLACGNHLCADLCHSAPCQPCKTSPQVVTHCNCGKVSLSAMDAVVERTSCTDSIPSCGQVCGKLLTCGGRGKGHTCQLNCHEGECECQLTTDLTCRCGQKRVSLSCAEAVQYTEENPYRCEKKCTKRRECGKHRCGLLCCILQSHPCMQICGKRLTCGQHKCQDRCHIGNCHTCYNVSFDELHCRCGVSILYPPIACGTKPPQCPEICNRVHECDHPVTHTCHSDESCPLCTVLTSRVCLGGHEMRNNIPCHVKDISCGRPCNKPLRCEHHCLKTCHSGDCVVDKCRQPCPQPRTSCGHPCGAECHVGSECPSTDCHQKIQLQCQCGRRKESIFCYMKYKKLPTAMLALKMKELNWSSANLPDLNALGDRLECDTECAILERNRRLASALEIDPEATPANQYPDSLIAMARNHPEFIAEVEKTLFDLVENSKQSKQESRSHSFRRMKWDQRKAVHELAELYSCETISYDDEPNRNVAVTARKDKAKQPTQTLTSFMKNEKHRPAPVPIPLNAREDDIRDRRRKELQSTDVQKKENSIDYFDYDG